jgi:hypothetical protein
MLDIVILISSIGSLICRVSTGFSPLSAENGVFRPELGVRSILAGPYCKMVDKFVHRVRTRSASSSDRRFGMPYAISNGIPLWDYDCTSTPRRGSSRRPALEMRNPACIPSTWKLSYCLRDLNTLSPWLIPRPKWGQWDSSVCASRFHLICHYFHSQSIRSQIWPF